MTSQSARATQRQRFREHLHAEIAPSTRDLFFAFADCVGASPRKSGTVVGTLWCLTNTDDPMTLEVLEEIHAERRRRLSAATREERRG